MSALPQNQPEPRPLTPIAVPVIRVPEPSLQPPAPAPSPRGHAAGGADEGQALAVFLVAGLFADQHERGLAGAVAGHDLGGVEIEVAALAAGHGGGEHGQGVLGGDEGRGGGLFGLRGDHGFDSGSGALHQLGQQGDLGEVLPVAYGHLRTHGLRVKTRRVEDGAVIALPQRFELILGGSGFFACAGKPGELLRRGVPGDGFIGGQDGPAHGREALGEEGRGELQDAVVGLVPGDEVFLVRAVIRAGFVDLAEADEGVHLVEVAADLGFHLL